MNSFLSDEDQTHIMSAAKALIARLLDEERKAHFTWIGIPGYGCHLYIAAGTYHATNRRLIKKGSEG